MSKNSVSGILLAHDADSKDSVSFTAGDSAGKYGSLHIDADGHCFGIMTLILPKRILSCSGPAFCSGFNITNDLPTVQRLAQHVEVWVDLYG
ncbi:VCBS domain-containing protein [Vibrio chagasii]|nr:VCBS domain-containing protein [Vibrio chagasii]